MYGKCQIKLNSRIVINVKRFINEEMLNNIRKKLNKIKLFLLYK